ncbi:GroES-like protein [Mytilinidion resinicola]|uniref:GroES-like protein n=1 Tax=Mytilinidion resinicola TaxID=574789 RepID=A0A6A6Y0K1_9PEZI|nr:GroES-like protein [Mytilinidion resinicola]KAF2801755.1 GroES-like protein [Mytilinidion resinicola]
MDALILDATSKTANVQRIPIPEPGPTELLVHVEAVALNPVDALYTFNPLGQTGRVVGTDFAGTVAALGSDVPSLNPTLKAGQRVAGFLQGACSANDRPGAFANYLIVPHDLVWRVQDSLSLAEAASVSLTALTAAQGLFPRLGLPAPFAYDVKPSTKSTEESLTAFIYGASTSVGLNATQLLQLAAKAHGMTLHLIGAASPSRHAMLSAAPYSFTSLVDYRDEAWPAQVRALTNGAGVDIGYDCISEGPSVAAVASTLSSAGRMAVVRSRAGKAWAAEPGTLPTEPVYGAVWEGLGERVEYQGFIVQPSAPARAFAVEFYKWLSKVGGSELLPNPIRKMPGGLERIVPDGFKLLGPGSMEQRGGESTEEWMRPVSGEKLVYEI